jgi:hypothetical protein
MSRAPDSARFPGVSPSIISKIFPGIQVRDPESQGLLISARISDPFVFSNFTPGEEAKRDRS